MIENDENQCRLWTPIRTKPRQEKKLARYCLSHGVSCYLPLRYKKHCYAKRMMEFSLPLLPGYLFARINENDYNVLVSSNAIVYRIKVDASGECGLKHELRALRKFELLSGDSAIEVRPELTKGAVVRISNGPMHGLHGVVENRKNKLILIVNIDLLGHSVSTEIKESDLDKD